MLGLAARVAPDASVAALAVSFVASVFAVVCWVWAETNWLAEACARTLLAADCARIFVCAVVREEVRL